LKKENLLFQAESLTFYFVFTTYLTFSKLKLSDFSKISIKASSSTIKMTKKTKSKQVKKREYELRGQKMSPSFGPIVVPAPLFPLLLHGKDLK